ncbi:unnamed protein product [Camellia sinensis]
MASSWDHLGEIANVAQITGLDAVRLIGLIVKAASTARMHKKNCTQFAQHLKLIGNLLEQLKMSELKKYPETREPLEQLEDALRRSYILVHSCQDRSYFYLLAMGWNIVYQFRRAQNEIDRYLKIVPLITLVDNARVRLSMIECTHGDNSFELTNRQMHDVDIDQNKRFELIPSNWQEKLEYIEMDQREYTMDDEDRKVQDVILRPDPSNNDTMVLKKTLSCSYPNLPFNEALQKENEKLQLELQRSQANLDVDQCEVIQHLIDVTEVVAANSQSEKSSPRRNSKKMEPNYSDVNNDKEHSYDESCANKSASHSTLRLLQFHIGMANGIQIYLAVVPNLFCVLKLSSALVGHFQGLLLWRPTGTCKEASQDAEYQGFVDDFLSHLMCCCCALVQEWREVEIRGAYGPEKTKTSPPPSQFMES